METDLIDEKIKWVNKRSVILGLVGAALAGLGMALLGPFSDGTGITLSVFVTSIVAFNTIYQLLFRFLGNDVFEEAKKRKKFLMPCRDQADHLDDNTDVYTTDTMYKNLLGNIHNINQ